MSPYQSHTIFINVWHYVQQSDDPLALAIDESEQIYYIVCGLKMPYIDMDKIQFINCLLNHKFYCALIFIQKIIVNQIIGVSRNLSRANCKRITM